MAGPEHKRLPARRKVKGSALLEAVAVTCILFFSFVALLQIYRWCVEKLVCQYAGFYGAKGVSLGYRLDLVRRSARVAALPISGESMGVQSGDESQDAENYLVKGDGSGVWYANWYPQNAGDPELYLSGTWGDSDLTSRVTLRNSPLIRPELGKMLGITANPDPAAEVRAYDHSRTYLEE